ncbi:helix-turn-helix transcriptional regulator [Microbulbifer magnicolonia]|uniref:helix-turn-helix domain-containing protein n=1 Tax=Microbulbifer magnicolonia TaxID=3109744 RepID=UPI002B4054E3|nr:helix-turn-helix transcriptional regulator [Microbulbifer sp. GG15]
MKLTPEQIREQRQLLKQGIEKGELTLGQAVRQMRKITGMNQKEYAQKIVGISPRILAEIERDAGNPTLETLNKIGRPFGYRVGFVQKQTTDRTEAGK